MVAFATETPCLADFAITQDAVIPMFPVFTLRDVRFWKIVAGPEAVIVIVVRPVVVPVAVEHTGIRSVVPVASRERNLPN